MASPLPLLLLGGIAALALGGKKKKKKPKSLAGEVCDVLEAPPSGYVCVDGIFEEAIDEDVLDLDDEAEAKFEIRSEDISPAEDEDVEHKTVAFEARVELCEEFLAAVHVVPTEPDELPIKDVVVEESVLPAMRRVLEGYGTHGTAQVDPEEVGPQMVREALVALVPACTWTYDPVKDVFNYDGRGEITSQKGQDVLFGLMDLSRKLIDNFNKPSGEPQPGGLRL